MLLELPRTVWYLSNLVLLGLRLTRFIETVRPPPPTPPGLICGAKSLTPPHGGGGGVGGGEGKEVSNFPYLPLQR